MRIGLIYALIVVFANSLGAISGMGGGVIIRPLLEVIGQHDVAHISFYSTVAVFTMATVSITRRLLGGATVNKSFALIISLGSVLGGVFGSYVFNTLLHVVENHDLINLIQIGMTVGVLILSLFYTVLKMRSFHLENKLVLFVLGLVLGSIASFLGIGGGPINVAAFMLFMAMPIKEATMYSIITIFFSQLMNLIVTGMSSAGHHIYDVKILVFIIPAAVVGGLLGSKLSQVFPEKTVTWLFQVVIIGVILLNVVNGVKLL